jgi:micrococcal nuclease
MKTKYVLPLLIFSSLGVYIAFQTISPSSYQGEVTRIIDGDTLEVDGVKIRLALVDAPESREPGFQEALQFTAIVCPVGSIAYVDIDDGQPRDKYGRTVAVVYCGGKNLNAELWKNGYVRMDEGLLSVSEFDPYSW